MNIFIIDESPVQAARDLCNKHVVKMLVESAQVMCTAYRIQMEQRWSLPALNHSCYPKLYKATHLKHPVVSWTLASADNTDWLWQHMLGLEAEYRARYGKIHATSMVLAELEGVRWSMWHTFGAWQNHTTFVQCMPDKYKCNDAVTAYRSYYVGEKASFARWQPKADPPIWWPYLER